MAKIIGVRASSNAKVLYSALTRYCNAEDRAWPTEQTLTNRLGWSESTVRRAIAELLRLGWLSKRQSRVNHGGTWAHNVYTLNTKPTLQRKKLRRHRRSNLTAGADQGKQFKPAGHNRRSNLTGRTRENEFQAKSNASRLDGAPHSPRQEEWPPLSTENLQKHGAMSSQTRSGYPSKNGSPVKTGSGFVVGWTFDAKAPMSRG